VDIADPKNAVLGGFVDMSRVKTPGKGNVGTKWTCWKAKNSVRFWGEGSRHARRNRGDEENIAWVRGGGKEKRFRAAEVLLFKTCREGKKWGKD